MSVIQVALSELKRMSGGILPKLVLLAISSIPLLYGGIYLYANWDPYGSVNEVSGALVMQDTGAENREHERVEVGQQVADRLKESADFDWHDVASRDEAVAKVGSGEYDFALVIPADFSENLQSTGSFAPDEQGQVASIDPQAAGLEVITNDANNYILTNIVAKAGVSIRDTVAAQVGEETARTLLASFTKIHSSVENAADGSVQVQEGTVQLAEAIGQIKDGTRNLSVATLELQEGTGQLADGSERLVQGQQQLTDGAAQLRAGAQNLDDGATEVDAGAQELAEGAQSLKTNLETAASGAAELSQGAYALKAGNQTLATGTRALVDGTGQLKTGTESLAEGATRLAEGSEQLNHSLQESGLGELSLGLQQVCAYLAADNSAQTAASLTEETTAQMAQTLRDDLAPLVAEGVLTQAQADAAVAKLTSESTKESLTGLNQQVLDGVTGQLKALGSSCAEGRSTVATDIDNLLNAVEKISSSAGELSAGATTISEKAGQLAEGAQSIDEGAQAASQGSSTLAEGADTLADGSSQLADGAGSLSIGAYRLADGTGQLAGGSSSLSDAAETLTTGEETALQGQKELRDGVAQVHSGTSQLSEGAAELDTGTGRVNSGLSELTDGTEQLANGLIEGTRQIPSPGDDDQNRIAATMSDPVNLNETSLASANTYGEGMGPFFMVLSLWIGALMLVQTMRPANTRALASRASSLSITLGSWAPFGAVGLLQTLLLYAAVRWALNFDLAHPWWTFWLLTLVSATYTAIIWGLVALLEAPGKLLALVILILQLVTAGGMMPYQTLPASIQWLHHILPMGYALSGVRRLAYGINLSALPADILVLTLWGLAGLALGLLGTIKNRTWTLKKLNPEISA